MRVLIGTSGYQYTAWRGDFYDAKCKERDMLDAYARALPTVEVNNTFYRMPKPESFARWASQVPSGFLFSVKAPKRITHVQRLNAAADSMVYLFDGLKPLADKLGCVLFQLPAFFHKDAERLRAFLERLPAGSRACFEFRHESWQDAEVIDLLAKYGAALCAADPLDGAAALQPTAEFGYVRLGREQYSDDHLLALRELLCAQPWREVFVYFKHAGCAPDLARRFAALFEQPNVRQLAKVGPAPSASKNVAS
jgi:uncharacterized protein YecE (DUF72 family)